MYGSARNSECRIGKLVRKVAGPVADRCFDLFEPRRAPCPLVSALKISDSSEISKETHRLAACRVQSARVDMCGPPPPIHDERDDVTISSMPRFPFSPCFPCHGVLVCSAESAIGVVVLLVSYAENVRSSDITQSPTDTDR